MAETESTTAADPALIHLGIYLNDHYAGATGGLELFRRAANSHSGTEAGHLLGGLTAEVAEDRRSLRAMMVALGVPVRQYKVIGAWALEKVGRLKPNGHLRERSPLSALVELEAMRLGVEGKAAGWRTLQVAAGRYETLDATRLAGLIERAQRQIDTLEKLRLQAAESVVGEC